MAVVFNEKDQFVRRDAWGVNCHATVLGQKGGQGGGEGVISCVLNHGMYCLYIYFRCHPLGSKRERSPMLAILRACWTLEHLQFMFTLAKTQNQDYSSYSHRRV